MISRVPDIPRSAEIQDGLNLIEARSGALGRFLRAYAQLARLPKPQLRTLHLMPLARRIAELENRLPVTVSATDNPAINADPDQIEQLLINIVATPSTPRSRRVAASRSTGNRPTSRCSSASRTRGRAPRYRQPLRPVLHDEAGRVRYRPGALAGRSPRRTAGRSRSRTGPTGAAAARYSGCRHSR